MKFLHLLLVTVLASAGYCTLGIMLAWPAAALPSLRWFYTVLHNHVAFQVFLPPHCGTAVLDWLLAKFRSVP